MAENFDLIFGSSASQSYSWNDSDYQNGWQTVGDTPPTREQFDALQRRADLKTQELNNRLAPIETKAETDGRQTAMAYEKGTMVTADGLPNGWLLECIVAGTTGTGALEIPSPLVIGGTIVDGTVTWKLLNLAMGGVPVGYVTPFLQSTAPDGWLSCAGAEVSRAAYPDLWAYVNGTTQVISESDWQSKSADGDINIGWFSSGDGSTTFRLPRIVGSGELTEVKRFTTAGAGSFVAPVTGIYRITLQGAGGGGSGATRSSSAYGARGGGGGGEGGNLVFYEQLTAGTSYSYTIGAGGAGSAGSVSATVVNASNGGDSSITVGNNSYVCTGGRGGYGTDNICAGGNAGVGKINDVTVTHATVGASGGSDSSIGSNKAVNGGNGGGAGGALGYAGMGGSGYLGGGGAGGGSNITTVANNGGAGGDGYIEFAYNPVPQYWYVRAFGSATNQGTIDITELANMLNAKLSISDVPKIAGFSGKQTFTSSGTFTPTITGNYKITLQGGGGGGGGASQLTYGNRGGGGGGAGGHGVFYEQLVAGTSYSFVVGAGGAGGAQDTSGTAGGASSITLNSNSYVANGGSGGLSYSEVSRGGDGGTYVVNGTTLAWSLPGTSGGTASNTGSTVVCGGSGGGNSTATTPFGGASGKNGAGGNGSGIPPTVAVAAGGAGGDGYITFEWQSGTI